MRCSVWWWYCVGDVCQGCQFVKALVRPAVQAGKMSLRQTDVEVLIRHLNARYRSDNSGPWSQRRRGTPDSRVKTALDMYKISYEKCVCFIFLVILAVLSCSGFRIDNLAMTDITKRNSNSDPNSPKTSEIFDRIFHQTQTPQTLQNPAAVYRHRIRHHRNLRAQARTHDRTHPPTGHTGTLVFPPGTQPSQVEHLRHQIPPTTHLQPTSPVATRSQRSPQNPKNRGTKRPLRCQREDISRKLYLAPIVVHAKVESLSGSSHPIHFKVLEVYKNSSLPVDDTIILTLHRKKSPMNCERNERFTLSQDYILFLRSFSAHNYTLFAASERLRGKSKARQKILNIVRKFTRPNFSKYIFTATNIFFV